MFFSRKKPAKSKLVFLGGTAANNTWRDDLIAHLVSKGISRDVLFDPVVKEWNEEAQAREEKAKAEATHTVYYLADPRQEGNPLSAYSMVEATMALYDQPGKTVVVFDTDGMSGHPKKAMDQTLKVLKKRLPEAHIFGTRAEALDWLCSQLL